MAASRSSTGDGRAPRSRRWCGLATETCTPHHNTCVPCVATVARPGTPQPGPTAVTSRRTIAMATGWMPGHHHQRWGLPANVLAAPTGGQMRWLCDATLCRSGDRPPRTRLTRNGRWRACTWQSRHPRGGVTVTVTATATTAMRPWLLTVPTLSQMRRRRTLVAPRPLPQPHHAAAPHDLDAAARPAARPRLADADDVATATRWWRRGLRLRARRMPPPALMDGRGVRAPPAASLASGARRGIEASHTRSGNRSRSRVRGRRQWLWPLRVTWWCRRFTPRGHKRRQPCSCASTAVAPAASA